jgi:hypothetical protein
MLTALVEKIEGDAPREKHFRNLMFGTITSAATALLASKICEAGGVNQDIINGGSTVLYMALNAGLYKLAEVVNPSGTSYIKTLAVQGGISAAYYTIGRIAVTKIADFTGFQGSLVSFVYDLTVSSGNNVATNKIMHRKRKA